MIKNIPLIEVLVRIESGSRPKGGASTENQGIPSLGAEHLDENGGFNFSNFKTVPISWFNSMNQGVIKKMTF